MILREETYLSPKFSSIEQLEKEVEFWDATTSQWLADCPRRGQYAIEARAVPMEEAFQLKAGIAIHVAMAVLYTTGDEELALATIKEKWGYDANWQLPSTHKYAHLSLGHLEVIFKNYLDWRKKHDAFKPLILHRDELDMSRVLAAMWLVTEDDRVVLGESKIVMEFDVQTKGGLTPFVYSGRPDLPIELGGVLYVLDHKSTNSYLSDWYFEQYRFSNQLRGYGAMLQQLIQKPISGALINGVYMGKRASLSEFKGDRFARYGPMTYLPPHLPEAIKNQYYWRKSLDFWRTEGYFPQHTGKLCGGCPFDKLCNLSPTIRGHVLKSDYSPTATEFLDL